MGKLLLDPAAVTRLKNVTERTELCDERGTTIGVFLPSFKERFGFDDFSREELDRRSLEREEYSTAEVLESLAGLEKN